MLTERKVNNNVLQYWKTHTKGFSEYTIVGIVFTVAYIFLVWLFVDLLKINTLISSCIVVVGLHIGKFITYHQIKLIRRQFAKYTSIQLVCGLLNISGLWFLIDVLNPLGFYSPPLAA